MSETYDAVYNAVRSKISGCDIGSAIESAMNNQNISHYAQMAGQAIQEAAGECARPCAVFKPTLSIDGGQWCALYGEDIQNGVAGFGDSPAHAMANFDFVWHSKIKVELQP